MPAAEHFVAMAALVVVSAESFVSQVVPNVNDCLHAIDVDDGFSPIALADDVSGAGIEECFESGNVNLGGFIDAVQPVHVVISLLTSGIAIEDESAGEAAA